MDALDSGLVMKAKKNFWRAGLEITTTLAVLAAAVTVIASNINSRRVPTAKSQPLPQDPIPIHGSVIRGELSAGVGLISYSDFECPFCARFAAETFPDLAQTYLSTGRAFFVFKHAPMEGRHPAALRAAQIAECARDSGRFWQLHDILFEAANARALGLVVEDPGKLGVTTEKLDECRSDPKALARVREDLAEARAVGVSGTPTFMIGVLDGSQRLMVRSILVGAKPAAEFRAALDAVIGTR
jgi:protein-disulfide isomerase